MKSKSKSYEGRFAEMGTPWGWAPPEHGIDHFKFELCVAIEYAMARKRWSHVETARRLKFSRAHLSRVANKRLDQLTINQLIRYLNALCPDFRIMVSIDSTLT